MLKPNKIYLMDNLTFLLKLPQEYFDLVYIDPPFYSQKHHDDFNDKWESLGEYLDFMNVRLKEIHRVLKSTGSLYVHLDYHASHYIKILLDKIFGCENFRNEIVWKRTLVSKSGKANFGKNNDYILYYVKSKDFTFNLPVKSLSQKQIRRDYNKEKKTGRYFTHSKMWGYFNRNPRKELYFKDIDKTIEAPEGYGFYWIQETLDNRLDDNPNLIYWTKNGTPRIKLYLDEHEGIPLDNLWLDIKPLSSNNSESLNYRTQKPEELLERIIQASSREGDMVGDFFLGSGTTCAVAKRLRRQWMGCDHNPEAIKKAKERLKRVKVYANILDFSRPNEESEEERDEKLTRWLRLSRK